MNENKDYESMEEVPVDYKSMGRVLDIYAEKGLDPKLEQALRDRIKEKYTFKDHLEELIEQKEKYAKEHPELAEKEILDQYNSDIRYVQNRNLERKLAREERNHKRKIQLCVRGTIIALGLIGGTVTLVKTPIGGKVKDFFRETKTSIQQEYNQFLENSEKEKQYQNMSIEQQVYMDTGMTTDEIVEKGRNIH